MVNAMIDPFGSIAINNTWGDEQYTSSTGARHYEKISSDQFRLLHIRRGQSHGKQDIYCTLHTYKREDAPEYNALSYAWGYGPAECDIILNGQQFRVRRNLHRFLQHAATTYNAKLSLIWIDTICINQADIEERNEQVQQMASVYSSAQCVVAWLGPEYDRSQLAIEHLRRPPKVAGKYHCRFWGGKIGQAIASLCVRQYWHRLWVLQELMLAKKIIILCGKDSMEWESFQNYIITVPQTSVTSPKYLDRYQSILQSPALHMVQHKMTSENERTLLQMFQKTRRLRCGQPRDRVFALLGLVNDRGDLRADYSIPMPVLANVVLRQIHSTHKPHGIDDVLLHCELLEQGLQLSQGSMLDMVEHESLDPIPRTTMAVESDRISFWWASHYKHTEIQRILMSSPFFTDRALFGAVQRNDVVATKSLIDSGLFDEILYDIGSKLLHVAVRDGGSAVVAALLATPGLELSPESFEKCQLLYHAVNRRAVNHWLLCQGRLDQVEKGSRDRESMAIIELLLGTGKLNHELLRDDAQNPLDLAISVNDTPAVRLLLSAQASYKHSSREQLGSITPVPPGNASVGDLATVGQEQQTKSVLDLGT